MIEENLRKMLLGVADYFKEVAEKLKEVEK